VVDIERIPVKKSTAMSVTSKFNIGASHIELAPSPQGEKLIL
jgi:hypothetical protein